MNWFNKIFPSHINTNGIARHTVPEGVWTKCEKCNAILYRAELERNLQVCPKCAHHMCISARQRLDRFLDPESRQELGEEIKPIDFLKFKDSKRYKDRLSQAQRQTGEDDALIVFKGKLRNIPVISCAFDFGFMGGSMGSVVGERFTLAAEAAKKDLMPLICFSASGGARMQEGLFSLMQMAKTSSVLAELKRDNIPYISILTNPTTGGVSASLAFLGDINIAEPDALIGFAGPRVIEQTVRATLPEGFQRSDFLLKHGNIDSIIDRREQRDRIASILSILMHRPLSRDDASITSSQDTAE